ncbi:MerR family transcriptional regulator [Pseudonocardiaceae bacterium YIM PH 21723]|nr:MerR family transcriptional regulator [Pseudonocardiaceae bacterium YIM PH 21723]
MSSLSIGQLAELTGLPVKTVRYYSDIGLVPETTRTDSGYRQYDSGSVLRLDLVRTLRELGLDLASVRRVLEHRATLAEVAAAQADALDTQIRTLRLHRSILRAVVKRNPTTEELTRMQDIARATTQERRRIIDEFLDSIFEGVPVSEEFESRFRSAKPDLPDDPSPEQVEAWVELAELVADQDFRAALRRVGERAWGGGVLPTDAPTQQRLLELAQDRAGTAEQTGVDPASAEARAVVAEVFAAYAAAVGREYDAEFHRELLVQFESGADPRGARYWELLRVINDWPPFSQAKALPWEWLITAAKAHVR